MKTLLWTVIIFLLALFAIPFSLQNTKEVSLQYSLLHYHWEIPPLPLSLVTFVSLFFGIVIGGLGDFYKRFRLKRALRQSQKTIERLEKEIESLRGIEATHHPLAGKE